MVRIIPMTGVLQWRDTNFSRKIGREGKEEGFHSV